MTNPTTPYISNYASLIYPDYSYALAVEINTISGRYAYGSSGREVAIGSAILSSQSAFFADLLGAVKYYQSYYDINISEVYSIYKIYTDKYVTKTTSLSSYFATRYTADINAAYNDQYAYLVYLTSPFVTISSDKINLAAGENATIYFLLNESSSTFDASDITVNGGVLTQFTGSDRNYYAKFIPSSNYKGIAKISIASEKFYDLVGNPNLDTSYNFINLSIDTTTTGDISPPAVLIFNPADESSTVAIGTNIVVSFNENIQRGAGNIVLKTSSGVTVATYTQASPNVTINGSTLTIDPAVDLSFSTSYRVEFASGSVKDLAGNDYAGTSTYNFTTSAAPDTTPPTLTTYSPADEANGVSIGTNIVLSFSENIQRGSGNIVLKTSDGTTIATYSQSSSNVTITGSILTINPTTDLNYNTTYRVDFATGSVQDLVGNNFAGTTTYNFTTNFIPNASASAITTKEDTARAATLAGTDAENSALTYAKVSDPSHGTITINGQTGAYTYTPAPNYYGTDSFSFKVNDGIVDSSAATVSITVAPITDITGQVYHWKNHTLLQGVQIVDGTASATTGSNGSYHVDAINPTADLLLPTLSTQNAGAAVDSADALAALKLAVGLNPNANGAAVSPYQFIAADVNEDGEVNSADALAILKMSVNRPDAPAAKWHFVNESADLWDEAVKSFSTTRKNVTFDKSIDVNTQSDVNVNLVAVLKGDVNGSWGAGVSASTLDTLNPNYFSELSSRLGSPQSQWGLVV